MKVMRGGEGQTDHKMVQIKLKMVIKPVYQRPSHKATPKINVSSLMFHKKTSKELSKQVTENLTANPPGPNYSVIEEWTILHDTHLEIGPRSENKESTGLVC